MVDQVYVSTAEIRTNAFLAEGIKCVNTEGVNIGVKIVVEVKYANIIAVRILVKSAEARIFVSIIKLDVIAQIVMVQERVNTK